MPSIKELGRRIKTQNPGEYDNLSDYEVGILIKTTYPDDYDDFTDELSVRRSEKVQKVNPSGNRTSKRVGQLIDYYNPSRGRFTSWWQRGKAEGRSKLLEALNVEQAHLIEQGAMLERAVLDGHKHASEVETFIRQNEYQLFQIWANEQLIEKALAKGLTFESDQQLLVAERLSTLKVGEHQQLKDIDLEARWKEILQDSNAADLALIGDHLVIKKLRQELIDARRERHAIRISDEDEELKQELLADYNKFISRLEAKIDERETGHLLSENRPKARELTTSEAESRAEYEPESDEDYE